MVTRNPRYNVRLIYAYDEVNVAISKYVLVNFDAMGMIVATLDPINCNRFMAQIRMLRRNGSFEIKSKAMDDNGNMYVKMLKIERN